MLLNISSGVIPNNSECPFKNNCDVKRHKGCGHMGLRHDNNFYCHIARSHEIMYYSNIRGY